MSCINTIQVILSDYNDTNAGLSENLNNFSAAAAAAAAIYVLEHSSIKIINKKTRAELLFCVKLKSISCGSNVLFCISR